MTPSPSPADLLREVREAVLEAGIDAFGVTTADAFPDVQRSLEARSRTGHHAGMSFTFKRPWVSSDPSRLMRNATSVAVGARAYREAPPDQPSGAVAAVARYAWRDHYADLVEGLRAGADVLKHHGHRAMVITDQNRLVDRAVAHRAGIGWWGKNSNLLAPGLGSWFVLGSIVTDAYLPPNETPVADGCRSCTRCIESCPTDAIVAPGDIDARRCLAWLVQAKGVFPRAYRISLGNRLYGCDDCQDVCPPGRNADVREGPTETALDAWVDVIALLARSDDELLEAYGRWYIPAREPRYLRRNALVILGNVGDASDQSHREAIETYAAHHDDLLRAHAVWAAARLGLHAVVDDARDDTSSLVRAEAALAASVPPAPGAVSTTPLAIR